MNDLAGVIAADAAATGPTDEVDKLLAQFLEQDGTVKDLEEHLRLAKEVRLKLQMELLPSAMEQARKKTVKYSDGAVLSLRPFIAAELPSPSKINDAEEDEKPELLARRTAGMGWLRDNQGAAIIKNELTVEIPKGKDNLVAELEQKCEELGLTWSRAENVHHQSLLAFLREKLKAGAAIPIETFKLVTGSKAHYKPGK